MDTINNYINKIIQITHSNLPINDGWNSFTLEALVIKKFIELNAFYTTGKGEKKSFRAKSSGTYNKDEDLSFLFLDLRKAMFDLAPNKGGWFTCIIDVENTGEFKSKYDYDNKPNFAYEPSDEKFIDDFNHFPREEKLIPDWLDKILLRNK